MAKIRKNYRLSPDVVAMIDTLLPFVSAEKNIKLSETQLIEMLVSERYDGLLKASEGGSERGSR